MRIRDDSRIFTFGAYSFAVLYALAILLPFWFLVASSFKDTTAIFSTPLAPPESLSFDRYQRAEEVGHLLRAIGVTLSIVIVAELIALLLAFPAAYAIARIPGRVGMKVLAFFNLGFFIPVLAILMPVFLLAVNIGLLNSPLMLMLFYPATVLPISILILTSHLRTVPREIEESAEIDGATRLQILWHVFLPLSVPGVITVLVLNFITIWNEFLFSLVLLAGDNRTIQVGLSVLKADHQAIDYGLLAAGSLITVAPVLLMFVFFQERVLGGILSGAVKG
jgi:multiple sugar transport system permease protein